MIRTRKGRGEVMDVLCPTPGRGSDVWMNSNSELDAE